MNKPVMTVVMPALNEEAFIEGAIRSLVAPNIPFDYELYVADGGSTDRTCQIVENLSRENARIKLVHNRKKYQSAAVNMVARLSEARILVRADCHATYPPGFLPQLYSEFMNRDAAAVVVPMQTVGQDFIQRAVAIAQNSRMGNGGSPHRSMAQSSYVDHGHHAAFDRQAFLELGGYDEDFTHNEDAELDFRTTSSSRKIWMASHIVVIYYPRKTFTSLARQYFNHGNGRAKNIFKHRSKIKIRQLLPVAILVMNLFFVVAAILFSKYFVIPPILYAALCLSWGAMIFLKTRDPAALLSGFAAMIMHHGWAVGFLRQCWLSKIAKG